MGYNTTNWLDRHMSRSDISALLFHLTKASGSLSAVDVLLKILKERTIVGSTPGSGFIVGNTPAVCFQNAPLYGIAQNIRYEAKLDSGRYAACGLVVNKRAVFAKGGRPVLYEKTEIAKGLLDANEYWRIVNLDLDDGQALVDWSHEREWRLPGDYKFDPAHVGVVVGTSSEYRDFLAKAGQLAQQMLGIVTLQAAIR